MLDTPWATAALDLVYPQTKGERPPVTPNEIWRGSDSVAARDGDVDSLVLEVTHLIKPRSVYCEPALQKRVPAVLDEMTVSAVT